MGVRLYNEIMAHRVETKLLDGKSLAAQVRKQVAEEARALKEANLCLKPKLAIVQVRLQLSSRLAKAVRLWPYHFWRCLFVCACLR